MEYELDDFDLGIRLSEINPDHFQRYYDHFVRFAPKNAETGYYLKHGYHRSWFQPKTRGPERRTQHLWEQRAIELTERHLDPDKWEWWKQANGEPDPPPGLQWLGFFRASHTMFNLIDFDAKDFIVGWYESGRQKKPVVIPTVEHFHKLRVIYDAFPNRVWCVSSDTLGVHAWERHDLDSSKEVHGRQKRVLQRIGLGSVEVHPMQVGFGLPKAIRHLGVQRLRAKSGRSVFAGGGVIIILHLMISQQTPLASRPTPNARRCSSSVGNLRSPPRTLCSRSTHRERKENQGQLHCHTVGW